MIEPPEIREPKERYRIVEIYVDLGVPRPDIRLFEIVTDWLRENPPGPIASLQVSYNKETDNEPAMIIGQLFIGEPIDVG